MMKRTAPNTGAFLTDVRNLRRRARVHMKRDAVTERHQAEIKTVALLNTLLATEPAFTPRPSRRRF
jgi:bacterioferritin